MAFTGGAMRKTHFRPFWRFSLGFLLTCTFVVYAPAGLTAQTCTVTAGTGTPDSHFNAEYAENGPGTGNEPLGMPGWTGADSTYSVLLPNGDTALFFPVSYTGNYRPPRGDGRGGTSRTGLRS